MSSNGYTAPCPVCWEDMDVCETDRPYPCIDCRCRTCGFTTYTIEARESLESCNSNREEWWEELITQKEYDKRSNHDMFVSMRKEEYNIQKDHIWLLKQIKGWEKRLDKIVNHPDTTDEVCDELDDIWQEMCAINM